jgi:hypothetical protein
VDQIIFQSEEEAEEQDAFASGDIVELFTYDMDIKGLWGNGTLGPDGGDNNSDSESEQTAGKRDSYGRPIPVTSPGSTNLLKTPRRLSKRRFDAAKGGSHSPDKLKSAMAATKADAATGPTHFAQDKPDNGAQAATSKLSGPCGLISSHADRYVQRKYMVGGIHATYTASIHPCDLLQVQHWLASTIPKGLGDCKAMFWSSPRTLPGWPIQVFYETNRKTQWGTSQGFHVLWERLKVGGRKMAVHSHTGVLLI